VNAVWPFKEPAETRAYTTRFVLDKDFPILIVLHQHDGSWEFLCGTTEKAKDAREIFLGEAVELDSRLREVADLPVGWRAYRDSPEAPWMQEPF
jgi:hypothetical protein